MKKKPENDWPVKVVSLAARRSRRTLLRTAGVCGWDVRPGSPQWIPGTPLHLYLVDTSAPQTIMAVVNWEDLEEIQALSSAFSWDESREALIGLLTGVDPSDIGVATDMTSRNEVLMSLAVRYVRETETFRRIPRGTAEAHVIILVYRPSGAGDHEGILRPFALVAKERQGLLQPEELRQVSARVIEQDRAIHPDWLPSAKILRI